MAERRSKRRLISDLLTHLLMGACLGLVCALLLIVTNAAGLGDFLAGQPDPAFAAVNFGVGLSLVFAVGATATGFAFSMLAEQ